MRLSSHDFQNLELRHHQLIAVLSISSLFYGLNYDSSAKILFSFHPDKLFSLFFRLLP